MILRGESRYRWWAIHGHSRLKIDYSRAKDSLRGSNWQWESWGLKKNLFRPWTTWIQTTSRFIWGWIRWLESTQGVCFLLKNVATDSIVALCPTFEIASTSKTPLADARTSVQQMVFSPCIFFSRFWRYNRVPTEKGVDIFAQDRLVTFSRRKSQFNPLFCFPSLSFCPCFVFADSHFSNFLLLSASLPLRSESSCNRHKLRPPPLLFIILPPRSFRLRK